MCCFVSLRCLSVRCSNRRKKQNKTPHAATRNRCNLCTIRFGAARSLLEYRTPCVEFGFRQQEQEQEQDADAAVIFLVRYLLVV
mmetsp:Transcript_14412/g.32389  ORF Transcript_14412/g.32389 Transcript_14412/m.32389 type:complete len:84 (-) Transcript_14412:87-338(-)